jgi:hypothetical protein
MTGYQKPAAKERPEPSDVDVGELFWLFDSRGTVYRVAVCPDGIQWLFQRRDPAKALAGGRWRTLGYCASRAGLARLHRNFLGGDDPRILALPDHIRRKGGAA